MTSIVRNEFRVFNVRTFKNSFSSGNNLYLGIGKPYFWDLIQNTDVVADIPRNDILGTTLDWEDMLHLKKINPANISAGVYREMWLPNVKYDAFRHDWNGTRASVYNGSNAYSPFPKDLSEAKYYVITPNFKLYICLKQHVVAGVVQSSTQNPETGVAIGVNTGIFKTADNYYWKFIGVTSPQSAVKFMTDKYHPVETISIAPGINDTYYPQWINQVNSAAFKQGIYTLNVLAKGTGYNASGAGTVSFPSANISISGNGSGLAGTVTFGSGGTVESIDVSNPGSGYTFVKMLITGGTGFSFEAILSPVWGLGVDPVRDLYAYYAIVNSTIDSDEGGVFTVSNSYRKISLVSNPSNYNSTVLASSVTLDATTTLTLTSGGGVGGYTAGSIVTDSTNGAKGRVVDWDSTTGELRVIRTMNENYDSVGASSDFAVSSTITPGTGVVVSIQPPTVQEGSGDIIYSEYRTPITRSLGQSESIILTLEF